MTDRANSTIAINCEVEDLLSNGVIVNVILRDLDLHFKCKKISNVNITGAEKASANRQNMTFIDLDICHRMAPIMNVVFIVIKLHIQCNKYHMLISRERTYHMLISRERSYHMLTSRERSASAQIQILR